MKLKLFKIFIVLILLSIGISFVVNPKAPGNQYYVGVKRPLVIAHQGGDGVWPGETGKNTARRSAQVIARASRYAVHWRATG